MLISTFRKAAYKLNLSIIKSLMLSDSRLKWILNWVEMKIIENLFLLSKWILLFLKRFLTKML